MSEKRRGQAEITAAIRAEQQLNLNLTQEQAAGVSAAYLQWTEHNLQQGWDVVEAVHSSMLVGRSVPSFGAAAIGCCPATQALSLACYKKCAVVYAVTRSAESAIQPMLSAVMTFCKSLTLLLSNFKATCTPCGTHA